MPVISDRLTDGAKLGRGAQVVFYARGLRDSVDGDAILTQARTPVPVDPETGLFTTPNLEPGPYWCGIKWAAAQSFENFQIVIGDTDTRLWPLLEEALPYTPAQESLFKQYRDEVAEFVTTAEGLSTAQDAAVAELVAPGTATKAVLDGTYAPSETAIIATQEHFPTLDTTGATSAVATLNAILAAAPSGVTIRLKGTYLLDGMVVIPPAKYLTVDASAATLILSGAGLKVRCLGSFGGGFAITAVSTEVLTVENKTRTFTKLTTVGTPPWVQGDVVKVIANDVIPAGHVTSTTTAPRVGEFSIVHSVSGNTVYLKNNLLETYTLNPRAARLNPGSARWIGGTVKVTEAAISGKQGITFLRFQNLINPYVSNTDVRSQTGTVLSFKSCFGYTVENPVQTYAMDNTDTANLGYGVHDSSCNDGRIIGGTLTGGRHGYTDGTSDSAVDSSDFADYGATLNKKIIGATARAMTAACWDTHHDSMGTEFIDCTAYPMTEEAGFLLRGRNHRVINPKVYGGNSVLRITTQLTDTWSRGESYGHELINPWSRGTRIGIDVAVREDAVHPSSGIRQEVVNVDVHGGVFLDGQYLLYARNARVRFHGGQRLQLAETVSAGTSGLEIRNTDLVFDEIEIDGNRVVTAGGSNRGIYANDTAGKGSDIRGRKYRIDGSIAYIATASILTCLTDTARCDVDDLSIEKYWNTSTPLTVPPGVAAAIRWHYPSENPSAGSSSLSRSSKVTSYTNAALATNTWQNLRLSGDEVLLLDAAIDDSTVRTLAQLWIGRRRGQRLTIYMSAANAGLTIQHGTSGRTLLSGATNRVLSAAGESLTLMWTGATWAQI